MWGFKKPLLICYRRLYLEASLYQTLPEMTIAIAIIMYNNLDSYAFNTAYYVFEQIKPVILKIVLRNPYYAQW